MTQDADTERVRRYFSLGPIERPTCRLCRYRLHFLCEVGLSLDPCECYLKRHIDAPGGGE